MSVLGEKNNHKLLDLFNIGIFFLYPENKQEWINFYNVYLLIFIYCILVLIFIHKICIRELREIINENFFILVLVLICFLSMIWSGNPKRTFASSVLLLGSVVYGIYISKRYSYKELLRVLVWYSIISGAVSLFTIQFTNLGVYYDSELNKNVWIGMYTGRNALSMMMSFGVLCSIFYLKIQAKRINKLGLLSLILCSINLYFTKGKTGIITIVIVVLIIMLCNIKHKFSSIRFCLCFITLCLVIYGNNRVFNNILTKYLGRNLTFTGRTLIWKYCIQAVKLKPLLGFGYNSFWLDKCNNIVRFMRSQLVFPELGSAHNGYISIALEIGLIGFLIYSIILTKFFNRISQFYYSNKEIRRIIPLGYMLFILFYNISENVMLCPNSIFLVLQVVFFNKVEMAKVEYDKCESG